MALSPTFTNMAPYYVPGPREPGVAFTAQLTGSGRVANTTTNVGEDHPYAAVSQINDVVASPFVSNVPCKCGVRNVDNACVTGQGESMPFEAPTRAQAAYLQDLWNVTPYMPVGAVDKYMMLREAPIGPWSRLGK